MRFKKNIVLLVSIIVCGFLNYNPQSFFTTSSFHIGWLSSLVGVIGIVLVFKFMYSSSWNIILGINFNRYNILTFLLLTAILSFLVFYVMRWVLSFYNAQIKNLFNSYNDFSNWVDAPAHVILSKYLYYIPQTFFEEIILGAFLLNSIKKWKPSLNNISVSMSVAFVFCILHYILYRFRPVLEQEILSVTCLLSLFLVGILRNELILRSGKIVYSWAVHLSWNLIFFTTFIITASGEIANEPQRFNLILGDFRILVSIIIITLLVLLYPKYKNRIPLLKSKTLSNSTLTY